MMNLVVPIPNCNWLEFRRIYKCSAYEADATKSRNSAGAPLDLLRKQSTWRHVMILHWWLIPVVCLVAFVVAVLYLAVSRSGGFKGKTGGRTVVDKPDDDSHAHSKEVGWNYYH